MGAWEKPELKVREIVCERNKEVQLMTAGSCNVREKRKKREKRKVVSR